MFMTSLSCLDGCSANELSKNKRSVKRIVVSPASAFPYLDSRVAIVYIHHTFGLRPRHDSLNPLQSSSNLRTGAALFMRS